MRSIFPIQKQSSGLFALSLISVALYSSAAAAIVVENGETYTVDSSQPADRYIVRGQSTLNTLAGSSLLDVYISDGSVLNMQGSQVNAQDYGVQILNASGTVVNSTIRSEFVGLNVSRLLGTVTGGSTLTVSNSDVSGVESGAEVTGLSTLVLDNSRVEGTQAGADGVNVRGGNAIIRNNSVITGANSGISIGADSDNVGDYRAEVDGSTVIGRNGAALAVVQGAQATIALSNGAQLQGANDLLLDVSEGSSVDLTVTRSTLQGNFNIRDNSAGSLVFDASTVAGDVVVESGSEADVALRNGAFFTGKLQNVNQMAVESGAVWALTGNQQLANLSLNQGTVDFNSGNGNFHQLQVENLSGSGTFVMNADYTTNAHDTLTVTGNATGEHTLQVAGSGQDPTDPRALTLVNTAAGDARFSLSGDQPVDVGTYSYKLESRGDGSGGTEWFLDPESKTVSPGTRSVLALFNTAPTVWYGELTSLRSRMGELRFNGAKAGLWTRAYSNKYDVAEQSGVGYSQVQSGFSLGADAPLPWGDGQWLVGALAGHSRSELDLTRGTSGSVDSYYVGAYTTWLDQSSGYYFDAVLKANRFDNKAEVNMSDATRAKGDYRNTGLGGSVEFGRHITLHDGWFVEPYGQLSAVVIEGKDYGLDNGMQAEGDQTRSLLGKLGSVAGRNVRLQGGTVIQPYVKAAVAHEFAKANRVQVNDNLFNNDLSGSRAEFGAGVAVAFTEQFSLHADFDYAKGEHIEQPYGVNIGMRYSW